MMLVTLLGASFCWLALAVEDAVEFEINPGWLGAAIVGSALVMASQPGFNWGDHLGGGLIGLGCGWAVFMLNRRAIGQGDIGLFGAMLFVGGADKMVLTIILFAGFAYATALIYASLRKKPFWKAGFPAAIPASCAAVLMLFTNSGWRL